MAKLLVIRDSEIEVKFIQQAKKQLKVKDVLFLPTDLTDQWSLHPEEEMDLSHYLIPIRLWLKKNAGPYDFIWIEGYPGQIFTLANFCKKEGWIPVYCCELSPKTNTIESTLIEENLLEFRKY